MLSLAAKIVLTQCMVKFTSNCTQVVNSHSSKQRGIMINQLAPTVAS